MQQEALRARRRTEAGTRPARRLRRAGQVPAIVYGSGVEPTPIAVDARELHGVLHTEAGLNVIIDLEIEGDGQHLTVAREIQRDPVRGDILHVDFITVRLDEPIEAEVAVEYEGTPVAVRTNTGLAETLAASVTVSALPTEIPTAIHVDVSDLDVGDTLKLSDLPELPGVTYLGDPDHPLLTIVPRAVEEEEAEAELEAAEEGVEAAAEPTPDEAADGDEG